MKIINSELKIHKRIVLKKWGREIIIHNDGDYCGKILRFNIGGKFSMHYHMKKSETWYVTKGVFSLKYIDTETANEFETEITVGHVIEIPRGQPHQLQALTDAEIFEVSTQHFDDDSYRIKKGDSQNG